MKIILSHTDPESKSHVWVSDFSTIDSVVDDNEATEIIVDSFLSAFNFESLEYILNKIVSKMRLNSKLVIYQKDIDILSYTYNKTGMALSDINSILFEDCPTVGCVLNIETIADIVKGSNLQITQKTLDNETMQAIITSRRVANASSN
tara:strand:- start:5504 stop:5947 length:444 start_codon:yes stop_codon:yes gene_type:complete